jgi:hypothetical protein
MAVLGSVRVGDGLESRGPKFRVWRRFAPPFHCGPKGLRQADDAESQHDRDFRFLPFGIVRGEEAP